MFYYLFSIDPVYKKVNSSYELYSFLKLLYIGKNSYKKEIEYDNLIKKINKKKVNETIKNNFVNNHAYSYKNMKHYYDDRYKDEHFDLSVGNSLLFLKTNHFNKTLFSSLKDFSFFVCDFKNQDYFWTSEFSC